MWLSPLFNRTDKGNPNKPRSLKAIQGFLEFISLVAIIPFIYLGTFSRYQADDYCFSRMLIEGGGYLGGLVEMYTKVSDRFSTMLVIGLLDPLGKLGHQILPGLLILIFFAGAILLARRIQGLFHWSPDDIELVPLVAIFVFMVLYTAPDLFQSVLWMSGSVTYFLPLGLFLFGLSGIVGSFIRFRAAKLPAWLFGLIFLAFVLIGGFSETTAALMTGSMILFGLLIFWKAKKDDRRILLTLIGASLTGLLAAMIIMILAPGNAYRVALMPEHPGLLKLIWLSFRYALGFAYQMVTSYPIPVFFSFLVPFILSMQSSWKDAQPRKWGWLFWAIPVFVLLVIVCSCAPSAYAQSAYPENRAMLGTRMVVTAGLMIWGYLAGIVARQNLENRQGFKERSLLSATGLLLVVVCFYLLNGVLTVLSDATDYQTRAAAWDDRSVEIDAMIAAGQRDLEITALDSYGRIREISDDPQNWVNKCAAVHYGVETIVAK